MATADRYIPSSSTFNALTEDYTYGYLEDNLWLETPLLQAMKKGVNYITGVSEQPLLEYARASTGGWYGRGAVVQDSVLQQLSDDIATRIKFELARYRQPILIDAFDTDAQGSHALVNLFNAYVRSGVEGMRTDLAYAVFNGDPDTNPDIITGLDTVLDDTASWGNLDPTASGYEFWRPHFMEGSSDGSTDYGQWVAPSLENHREMIRKIYNTTRAKPDLIVVSEDLWPLLAAQVDPNDNAVSRRMSSDKFDWGFVDLTISGIPVFEDLDMLGEAWVSGQATRAAAKGYQTFFLNLDKLWISANRQRSWKWDPRGWTRPTNMDAQLNFIYCWMQIAGNNRRAHGRIWNQKIADMDLDAMAAVGRGTVTRPEAS